MVIRVMWIKVKYEGIMNKRLHIIIINVNGYISVLLCHFYGFLSGSL